MILDDVRDTIIDGIADCPGICSSCFLPPFSLEELADCIIMELIKPAFEASMEKKSIRTLLKEFGYDTDADRMRFSRRLAYAQHYRNLQNERVAEMVGHGHPDLLPDNMESIEDKIAGHKLTSMQFFELVTMDRLPILQAIVSKRIVDTHKISNTEFKRLFEEYDLSIAAFKEKTFDDFNTVFYTFALYTLEWKYGMDFFYQCICDSESSPSAVLLNAPYLLAAEATLNMENGRITTENRFILHRKELIRQAQNPSTKLSTMHKVYDYLYIKYMIKCCFTIDGVMANDFIKSRTTLKDWASFIRQHYPLVSQLPTTHTWTNKQIRTFRNIVDAMFINAPTPKL